MAVLPTSRSERQCLVMGLVLLAGIAGLAFGPHKPGPESSVERLHLGRSRGVAGDGTIWQVGDGRLVAYSANPTSNGDLTGLTWEIPGDIQRLYDWHDGAGQPSFLVSLTIPGALAPSKQDLFVVTSSGAHKIAADVSHAFFSPNGQYVAFTTTEQRLRVAKTNGEIVADLAGAAAMPSWSPDGGSVVFLALGGAYTDLPETRSVALLELESGSIRYLTDGTHDDSLPSFHPSGEWVVFVSGDRSGEASLWAISVDGGAPWQLTNGQAGSNARVPPPRRVPQWSPDGRRLAFDFIDAGNRAIWIVNFRSGIPAVESAMPFAAGTDPVWLDGGSVLAFNGVDGPSFVRMDP